MPFPIGEQERMPHPFVSGEGWGIRWLVWWKRVSLAAAASRTTAHASVTAAVADHDGAAGVATGRVTHVEILLHGVGRVKDGPTLSGFRRSEDSAVFHVEAG